jgi:hypothetical protein
MRPKKTIWPSTIPAMTAADILAPPLAVLPLAVKEPARCTDKVSEAVVTG